MVMYLGHRKADNVITLLRGEEVVVDIHPWLPGQKLQPAATAPHELLSLTAARFGIEGC
jgi:hypothetical protein